MREPPEVFRRYFYETVPGAAEAIREEASAELATFAKSPGFLKLLEQSREAWRAVGIDPALPVVGRLRQLAAVAGLAWEESEKLIHDEPPAEWFAALQVRARAAARDDAALPAAAAAAEPCVGGSVAGSLGGELVSAGEIAEFAEIESRVVRRILESVKFEPGPVKRWRWDLARPVLRRWSENHRIARLRPLKWPEDPSQLKNPAKNPGRIRR
jgi:hypothetical protein